MKKKEKSMENNIYMILGLVVVVCSIILAVNMVLSREKYLPSENISVVSNTQESKNQFEKVEKIQIKTVGIAVDSYSFDGGINWQKSSEYYATDSEKLIIVVRDTEGKESEPIEYKVSKVDSTAPVISVKLPKTVVLNSKINLGEYVSVTDENSGVDGTIVMKPDSLDTSTLGVKTINFSAKDKAGNEANINVSIEVVKPKEDSDVNIPEVEKPVKNETTVLYRYRVKNLTEYNCNSYDCSYYDESGTMHAGHLVTQRCRQPNEKVTFRNGCYIVPTDPRAACTQAFTTVDRYKEYKVDDWTYVIDIYALDSNGNQIKLGSNNLDGSGNKEVYDKSGSQLNTIYSNNYKAEPCGKNEISINGYCHVICSGSKEATCEDGYELIDNKCKKYIKKTCFDKCTKYTWSKWSEWSETVVSPSDTVQVETKVVNE